MFAWILFSDKCLMYHTFLLGYSHTIDPNLHWDILNLHHMTFTLCTSWPVAPQAVRILIRSPFLTESSGLNLHSPASPWFLSGAGMPFLSITSSGVWMSSVMRSVMIQRAENFNFLPKMLMSSSSSWKGNPSTRCVLDFHILWKSSI